MKDRTRRRKFNRNYRKGFQLGKLTTGFVLVAIFFTMCLLYLSQSNKIALRGYDIAKLEKEKKELLAQQQELSIQASRLQSIQQIQGGLKDSGMVPVNKINYLPATSNVAINR